MTPIVIAIRNKQMYDEVRTEIEHASLRLGTDYKIFRSPETAKAELEKGYPQMLVTQYRPVDEEYLEQMAAEAKRRNPELRLFLLSNMSMKSKHFRFLHTGVAGNRAFQLIPEMERFLAYLHALGVQDVPQ